MISLQTVLEDYKVWAVLIHRQVWVSCKLSQPLYLAMLTCGNVFVGTTRHFLDRAIPEWTHCQPLLWILDSPVLEGTCISLAGLEGLRHAHTVNG